MSQNFLLDCIVMTNTDLRYLCDHKSKGEFLELMGKLHQTFLFEARLGFLMFAVPDLKLPMTFRYFVKFSFGNKYENLIFFCDPFRNQKLSVLLYFHGKISICRSPVRIWSCKRTPLETLVMSLRLWLAYRTWERYAQTQIWPDNFKELRSTLRIQ